MSKAAKRELFSSLKELHANPEFSDLVISTRSKEYSVHKAIVCPRSSYLAEQCRQLKSKDVLNLPDDDPSAVGMTLHYLYHLDYPSIIIEEERKEDKPTEIVSPIENGLNGHGVNGHGTNGLASQPAEDAVPEPEAKAIEPADELDEFLPPSLTKKKGKKKKRTKSVPAPEQDGEGAPVNGIQEPSEPDPPSEPVEEAPPVEDKPTAIENGIPNTNSLTIHAKVHTLSRKYGIKSLTSLALSKFQTEAADQWSSDEFLRAAREVYSAPEDEGEDDRSMKEVVIGLMCQHGELLAKTDAKKAVQTLPRELLYDVLIKVQQQGGFQ